MVQNTQDLGTKTNMLGAYLVEINVEEKYLGTLLDLRITVNHHCYVVMKKGNIFSREKKVLMLLVRAKTSSGVGAHLLTCV